jgi:CRP/FNR family cyclic AMP-dependent transcriptional regulator
MTEENALRTGSDFVAGHVLFRDGDEGRQMFVVQSGRIRISKSIRAVDTTLAMLGPGEFFGEMSILNNQPRSATATVEDNAKLLVIDAKTFETMLRGNVEIAVRMIKKLASRLQETDEQVENLLLKDPASRVVHHIMCVAARWGKPSPEGITLELNLKDMASKMNLSIDLVTGGIEKIIRAKLATPNEKGLLLTGLAQMKQFLSFLEMKEKFGDT